MQKLHHNLGDTVKLKMSDEHGEVIGIAIYDHTETNYYVRYKAADGRQVQDWWGESAIETHTAIAA